MKHKKLIGLLTTIAISMSSVTAFAGFWDVASDASYSNALERVSALGIINGTGDGAFSPDDAVTREQFATMVVKAAGLQEKAAALKGSSVFIDVDPYGWSSGYINEAVEKSYIAGRADNRFYPQDNISYAEACTILVKALGYSDTDISGTWPKSYIEKAKTLGISSGINIGTNASLPRWAAALMINNLLDINVKSSSTTAKTFAESTGTYSDAFIFANAQTNSKLLYNQILTDKGIYYTSDGMQLELSGKYRFVIDEDKILYAYNTNANVLKISVDSIIDNKITYTDNGVSKNLTLPDKTSYYYQGSKQNYDTVKSAIQTKSSIIMVYNKDNTGFENALVFDPVVSKPYVVQGLGADANIPEQYNPGSKPFIAKGVDDDNVSIDGKTLTISNLELYDVLYNVTDIWGGNRYVLLVRNKIKGTIDSILPDKAAPTKVTVDGTQYTLSEYFNASKLNTSSGSFKIDDGVILVRDSGGKVVDIYNRDHGDYSNYALVLNSSYYLSSSTESNGKMLYKVTLLHYDGTTDIYDIDTNPIDYKGKLVKFEKTLDKKVTISKDDVIDYMDTDVMQYHTFDKNAGTLDGDYISDNAVIFNLISNVSGEAARAEVIDLDQIPAGKYYPKKILYYVKAGIFNDITLLVTSDILDNQEKQGVVTATSGSGQTKTYTILIDGTLYTYTGINIPTVLAGSILRLQMKNDKVSEIEDTLSPVVDSRKVDAIDSKRIKINGIVYWFSNTATVYLKDSNGNVKKIYSDDVDLSETYTSVKVYLKQDDFYDGKVTTVVITE